PFPACRALGSARDRILGARSCRAATGAPCRSAPIPGANWRATDGRRPVAWRGNSGRGLLPTHGQSRPTVVRLGRVPRTRDQPPVFPQPPCWCPVLENDIDTGDFVLRKGCYNYGIPNRLTSIIASEFTELIRRALRSPK